MLSGVPGDPGAGVALRVGQARGAADRCVRRASRRGPRDRREGESNMQSAMAQHAGVVGAEMPVRTSAKSAPGLEYSRYFSREGVDPFDEIEWELRSAVIGSEKGEVVFEQRDVEIPKSWSQL